MSFPRYPKYKASGVEWLGEVPEHWAFAPLKHIADFINGDAFKPSEWAESGIPIVRIQNLNGSEEFNYFDGEVESRYLVHDGDLLFGWSGNRGTSFGPFLWRRTEVCALNQHIFRVVPKSLCKSVLFWSLKAVTTHVEDQAHGIIGMVHITKGDLGAIVVPVPPVAEQTKIASFLDRETAKIDGLVGEQRRLMELLKEKRQAVISHAVTKGLNPHAPLKPSGIEWLGDVPEHWQAMRLKQLSRTITDGEHISPSVRDEGVPLLSAKDVRDWRIDYDVDKYVTEDDAVQFWKRCKPEKDDVLIVSRGATVGRIGVVEKSTAFCLMGSVILCKPMSQYDSAFLYFVLNAKHSQTALWFSSASSAQQAIYIRDVAEVPVAVPPAHERDLIVRFLMHETAKLDSLTAEAERGIELLQERRTALISAAVTGQIDVRGLVETEAAS